MVGLLLLSKGVSVVVGIGKGGRGGKWRLVAVGGRTGTGQSSSCTITPAV